MRKAILYMARIAKGASVLAAIGAGSALAEGGAFENNEANARQIEEVIVTAQRTSESIQDVPIAVTALTGDMLEERGIITPSDLQMNSPSLSYTSTNFGGYSFSIRGIGNLVIGGESGVSTHLNEIPISSNMNAIEFYDLERVEVLRGPQGTLFGRNATGGAVNFVTKRPDFDSINGFIDVEAGDYNNFRTKGAINFPVTDTFALRFAGLTLDRDGYIENTAFGQVADNGVGAGKDTISGIDDDIDGRDLYSARLTGEWAISDNANLWVMLARFNEKDDRARITNQVCKTNPVPTLGCLANEFGFEEPNAYAGTGGIIFGLGGNLYSGFGATVEQKYDRGATGFRKQHTDFEPVFKEREDIVAFGFDYALEAGDISVLGAWQERDFLARQDFFMNTGALLAGGAVNFPVSRPAGGAGDDWRPGPCNLNNGTSGAKANSNQAGGCTLNVDGSVYFAYDQADAHSEYYTLEAKFASNFEGPFNFTVGANTYDNESYSDYYVLGNSLDLAGLYPGFFNNTDDPSQPTVGRGWAVFGETYYDITEDLKFTLGLRFNNDRREDYGTSILFNSFDLNGDNGLKGALGLPTQIRRSLGEFVQGKDLGAANTALASLYGVTQDEINTAQATSAGSPERIALSTQIPPVPQAAETRYLTNSPTQFTFREWSGRAGLDYRINDNSMVYGFYSRGYKPGGLNPAIPADFQNSSKFSFDSEKISAFEVGSKNTVMDGSMLLNSALFYYDYKGLQVSRIVNNSAINENIDATIWGIESEMIWRPDAVPGLNIDLGYSYTKTKVGSSESIDPTNRTAGNPAWRTLNNLDPGALQGTNFIAEEANLAAALPGCLALKAVNNTASLSYPDGTPALWSRNCLNASNVTTSDGLTTSLSGNELPNTPKQSISLGMDYTWKVERLNGDIVLRWDYYWQGESFAREFNTVGDEIDSWDQHNAKLFYTSSDQRWHVSAFVRNIQNKDNVTGHYLTSDTSGFFRNYFLTEPRIWGASLRYSFGS